MKKAKKNVPASRKDKRKQERQEKKLRKKVNFLRNPNAIVTSNEARTSAPELGYKKKRLKTETPSNDDSLVNHNEDDEEVSSEDEPSHSRHIKNRVRPEDDEEVASSEDETSHDSKRGAVAQKAVSSKARKQVEPLNEDEMEVMRLEKKLGINNKKSKDTWKKLEKGLLSDGFDLEILEFLKEGEKLLAKEAKKAKGRGERISVSDEGEGSTEEEKDDNEFAVEEEEDEEDIKYGGSPVRESLDDSEVKEVDEKEDGGEREEDEDTTSSDNESDDHEEDEKDVLSSAPTTFLPSDNIYGEQNRDKALPGKIEVVADRALDIKVRSLLNRSSQENASHTVKELVKLFASYPIRLVLESISRAILEGASSVTSLLFAGIAFAMETHKPNLVSQLIETIVLRVERGEIEPAQLRLLANFCALGACASSLLFEIVDAVMKRHRIVPSPSDEETLVAIVEACGWKLRGADPVRFRQTMLDAASTFDSQRLEMHGRSKIEYSMEEDRVKKWRKWLTRECKEGTSLPPPLTVPMIDFINAQKNGRWWVLGASWNVSGVSVPTGGKQQAPSNRGGDRVANPIALTVRNASREVIRIAIAQGFKTEVQKAVFCSIVAVDDYIQAFDNIIKLNLNDAGEREAVRVVISCCVHSKRYNPFFGLLAARLCSIQPRYRFSFQLAIWDQLKDLDEGVMNQQQIIHLARFVASLILQFALSLAVFKTWNFAKVSSKEKLWFMRECLLALLVLTEEESDGTSRSRREGDLLVAQVFSRLRTSKDGGPVRDGILVFWARTEPFMGVSKAKDPLLYKRLNIARRVMEHYVHSEDASGETIMETSDEGLI